jgi:hypothetical protein
MLRKDTLGKVKALTESRETSETPAEPRAAAMLREAAQRRSTSREHDTPSQTLAEHARALRLQLETIEKLQDPQHTQSLDEGFSLSVPTLDVLGNIYDMIARSHFAVGEALAMVEGAEPTSLSPDAERVLGNVSKHLKLAHQEVYKAMRAVLPDVEYHSYRDMPV